MRATEAELARLRAAQRVVQHAVAAREAPADILAARAEGWSRLGLDPRDAEALRAVTPGGDVRRIAVYRRLVRHTLRDVLDAQIPRTVARLGEAFDRYTAAYFEEELPRSQILRDVAYEWAAWALPRWADDPAVPPYAGDLARWELCEFDVYTARKRLEPEGYPPASLGEALAAEHGVAFDGSMRLCRLDHRVHELPDDPADETLPERGEARLLAYRDREGTFRRMTLTPIAFGILRALWRDGGSLAEAVRRACAEANHPIDQRVLDGTGEVLADLAERGVVLGALVIQDPPAPPSPFAHWLIG